MDTTTWAVGAAALLVVILALVAAARAARRRKESRRLQGRFGAEYARTLERFGKRSAAEADLLAREARIRGLNITTLLPSEAARFNQAWNAMQARFIDNPKGVVVQADHLVYELMAKRGYPMGDFEQRAADLSVDHPEVLSHYRAARGIALRDEAGTASTEELRKAVVHYRALFQALLEVSAPEQPSAPAAMIRAAKPRGVRLQGTGVDIS